MSAFSWRLPIIMLIIQPKYLRCKLPHLPERTVTRLHGGRMGEDQFGVFILLNKDTGKACLGSRTGSDWNTAFNTLHPVTPFYSPNTWNRNSAFKRLSCLNGSYYDKTEGGSGPICHLPLRKATTAFLHITQRNGAGPWSLPRAGSSVFCPITKWDVIGFDYAGEWLPWQRRAPSTSFRKWMWRNKKSRNSEHLKADERVPEEGSLAWMSIRTPPQVREDAC